MKTYSRLWVVVALLVFCLAPAAFADQIQLVGVFPSRTGGSNPTEYLTPYKLSINGGPVVLGICDDFWTSVSIGAKWTANPYDLSNPAALKFGSQGVEKYWQAAYLGNMLLALDLTSVSTLADQTALSFAIWETFDNNPNDDPFNHLTTTQRTLAQSYMTQAQQNATASSFAGWTAYTPNPLTASQEMLVRTPEPAAIAILGLNMAVLMGLAFAFRKRIVRLN